MPARFELSSARPTSMRPKESRRMPLAQHHPKQPHEAPRGAPLPGPQYVQAVPNTGKPVLKRYIVYDLARARDGRVRSLAANPAALAIERTLPNATTNSSSTVPPRNVPLSGSDRRPTADETVVRNASLLSLAFLGGEDLLQQLRLVLEQQDHPVAAAVV